MATINHKTYNEATETFKDFSVYDGKETLIFKVDGSEGNVGIGTSSPTDTIGYGRALDIQSSTGAVVYLRDSNAPTTQYGFLAFDGTDNGLKLHNANSSGFLRFDTNATERLRITSAGNVGIGNSSPPTSFALGSSTTGLSFTSASSSLNSGKIAVLKQVEIGSGNGDLTIETYAGGAGGGERMRITSTGSVGIGTSSPAYNLHVNASGDSRIIITDSVQGSTANDGTYVRQSGVNSSIVNQENGTLQFGTNNSFVQTILANGNVGIGTSSPTEKLDVNGAVAFRGATASFASASAVGMIDQPTSGITRMLSFGPDVSTLGSFQFYITGANNTGGVSPMTITNTGNVGIGTASPTVPLDVVGATSSEQFRVGNTTGGTDFGITVIENDAVVLNSAEGATARDLVIQLGGTERARFTANGLTFNGDTAAANALDDYEEGTFTATLSPSDSGSISLSAATCTYTKIGRQVVVKGLIAISSVSTPVGASVTIGGLPFTIINSTAGRGSFSVVILDASASYTAATYPTQHTLNATSLIVYVNASTIEPNDEIMFTATYFV
jgi:hypothetical protein